MQAVWLQIILILKQSPNKWRNKIVSAINQLSGRATTNQWKRLAVITANESWRRQDSFEIIKKL